MPSLPMAWIAAIPSSPPRGEPRWSTPEEVGQTHGELAVIKLASFGIVAGFIEIEKTRRGENDAERRADGDLEGFAGFATHLEDCCQLVDERGIRCSSAKGSFGELGEDGASALDFGSCVRMRVENRP